MTIYLIGTFIIDKLYGFALREIDIDMMFEENIKSFEQLQLEEILLKVEHGKDGKFDRIRKDNCLLYLFTGREVINNGVTLHGIGQTGVMFSNHNDNVGAVSIAPCKNDPWKFACLLTCKFDRACNQIYVVFCCKLIFLF